LKNILISHFSWKSKNLKIFLKAIKKMKKKNL
jgi:hypothetical protein